MWRRWALRCFHRLTSPACQVAKARKRKVRKVSKNQRQIGEETLVCADWFTVIISLEAEYCGEEILHLDNWWTIAQTISI